MAAVSGVPSSVTTPSCTMTEYQLGSERPWITSRMPSSMEAVMTHSPGRQIVVGVDGSAASAGGQGPWSMIR